MLVVIVVIAVVTLVVVVVVVVVGVVVVGVVVVVYVVCIEAEVSISTRSSTCPEAECESTTPHEFDKRHHSYHLESYLRMSAASESIQSSK